MSAPRPARILIVDDEVEIVAFVRELLVHQGYEVSGLSDSRLAKKVFDSFRPDLCILDFRMPHLTGGALLDAFKSADPTVEVIFLTAEDETTLAVDVMKRGSIDFLLKPVDVAHLSLAIRRALDHRRLVLENEAYRLHLERLVDEKTQALNDALRSLTFVHSGTLDALALALDYRDQSTSGHSRRVSDLTVSAAAAYGLEGSALLQIEHGALLHDIGKLKIPDSILWKPARLTEDEWTVMQKHPAYGHDFLRNIEFLKGAAELVLSHHEKFDGSGYPRRLKGEEIPVGARIFCIVDAVDAMIYKRPYNTPVTFKEAAQEVRRCAGTHFDPAVIDVTLDCLEKHVPKQLRG
jgi:response regulator RpfG family c-di-GMP phosphodiesterase